MREPMTCQQIAEELGISNQAAKDIVRHALKKLRTKPKLIADYRAQVHFATNRGKTHYERLEDMA